MSPLSPARISIFENDQTLGSTLALGLFNEIEDARNRSENFVLGCPGGRSPRSTYLALGQLFSERKTAIDHLYIAMMDEYAIRGDDGNFSNVDSSLHFSCAKFAYDEIRNVFNQGLPKKSQLPFDQVLLPDARDPQKYEETLNSIGIDCFLLASGVTDGHVAFNGIGTPRDAKTRVAALSDETRTDNLMTFPQFQSLSEVPKFGVTVGPSTISSLSKSAIMILQGPHKGNAFRRIANAPSYDPNWPATIVSECQKPQLFADASAANA
ncbi:MAG: 6-phosphogluconolactonase [Actinobacteria bacterium]|nr:6-phosphogluconolactonase [Actinomycetota bacterium]